MPITAITIENFKGIKGPVRIELKPITLLFGPNSAGKSTVIQALHYAKEIFERENVNAGRTLLGENAVDLGGFEALVHRHDMTLPIKLRLDLDCRDDDLPRYLEGYEDLAQPQWEESPLWEVPARVQSAWVEIVVEWSDLRNKPLLKAYRVGANGAELAVIETSDDGRQVYISRIDPFHPVFLEGISPKEANEIVLKLLESHDHPQDDFEKLGQFFPILLSAIDPSKGGLPGMTQHITLERQSSALPTWGSPLAVERSFFPDDLDFETEGHFIQVLSSLIVGPGELVRDALRRLCYIGPLRTIPPRNFVPSLTPDETRWANGLGAWDTLFKADEHFIDRVNDWLDSENRLNCGYRVEVREYKELDMNDPMTLSMLQDSILDEDVSLARHLRNLPSRRRLVLLEKANGIEVQPYDIGVGISQVLPVIIASLHARSGFVIIEQPELHVHPGLQVALGDLFIEQTNKYPDLTFLLETHSEHVMLRLMRRIRETSDGELPPGAPALSPASLSIYFSEQGENGITFLPIGLDREGEFIDRWPRGFFSERMGELY